MGQEYPEVFEETTLAILHDAFLKASSIMAEIGFHENGSGRYWEIKHAAQNILEAMDKIEDACYEWRSYRGDHDPLWGGEEDEEKKWDAFFANPVVQARLEKMAEEAKRQHKAGETEDGGFAVEGKDSP